MSGKLFVKVTSRPLQRTRVCSTSRLSPCKAAQQVAVAALWSTPLPEAVGVDSRSGATLRRARSARCLEGGRRRSAARPAGRALDGSRKGSHLTLAFIGEVDGSARRRIADALAPVQASPLGISLHGMGHFPPRGPHQGSLDRSLARSRPRLAFTRGAARARGRGLPERATEVRPSRHHRPLSPPAATARAPGVAAGACAVSHARRARRFVSSLLEPAPPHGGALHRRGRVFPWTVIPAPAPETRVVLPASAGFHRRDRSSMRQRARGPHVAGTRPARIRRTEGRLRIWVWIPGLMMSPACPLGAPSPVFPVRKEWESLRPSLAGRWGNIRRGRRAPALRTRG